MNLNSVRAEWERLGQDDPLWAVYSKPGTEHGGWDIDEFLLSGRNAVAKILEQARLVGADPARGSALDFGCGVGRLSLPLADHFESVTGLDIAASMVRRAQILAKGHDNVDYQVSMAPRLPFSEHQFDFVLALIVLQHMSRSAAEGYIREFLRVLRPGGVIAFQAPGDALVVSNSSSALKRRIMGWLPEEARLSLFRLRHRHRGPRDMLMTSLPPPRVFNLVRRAGGVIVAALEDDASGEAWRSYRYFVTTDGRPRRG